MRPAWAIRTAAAMAMLVMPGCAPTVVATAGFGALQAGTTAFVNGELESAQVAPLEAVSKATVEALAELQFKIVSQKQSEYWASYHAREHRGRSITIELSAKSPVVTKTNIRVGLMGDQVMSRLILGEIQARCPAIPAPAPVEGDPKP